MPVFETIALLVLLALGWFWLDSLRARDAAVAAARAECQRLDEQFLDESVVLHALRPMRNDAGQLVIGRTYFFEYSETGTERRRGSVVLLGKEVIVVNAGVYLVH